MLSTTVIVSPLEFVVCVVVAPEATVLSTTVVVFPVVSVVCVVTVPSDEVVSDVTTPEASVLSTTVVVSPLASVVTVVVAPDASVILVNELRPSVEKVVVEVSLGLSHILRSLPNIEGDQAALLKVLALRPALKLPVTEPIKAIM